MLSERMEELTAPYTAPNSEYPVLYTSMWLPSRISNRHLDALQELLFRASNRFSTRVKGAISGHGRLRGTTNLLQ